MMNAATLTVTTPSDRDVMVVRSFDAPRRLVWAAHTQAHLVRRWIAGPSGWSMAVCEIDLRVDGRYRYELHGANGEVLAWGGIFLQVVPPERLVSVEQYDQDWTGGETVNTLVLEDRGERTLLNLTVRYSSEATRDAALKTGMTTGMDAGYRLLDEMLRSMAAKG
jgi:uncharacterized protein YndB with AHSA1/START domain